MSSRRPGPGEAADVGLEGPLPERFADYQLLRRVGRRPAWVTFLAHSPDKRFVRLRVAAAEAADAEVAEVLHRARGLLGTAAEGVAGIVDVGQHAGYSFVASEDASGVRVDHLLAALRRAEVPLVRGAALTLVAGALRALAGLEAESSTLRWAVPALPEDRLVVTWEGRVLVVGLELPVSSPSVQVGTAPEVLAGMPVGGPSVVFAAGVRAYELLTGSSLLEGVPPERWLGVARRGGHRPARWEQLLPDDQRVLVKALHPDPNRRFEHVGVYLDEVQALLAAQGGAADLGRLVDEVFPGRRDAERAERLLLGAPELDDDEGFDKLGTHEVEIPLGDTELGELQVVSSAISWESFEQGDLTSPGGPDLVASTHLEEGHRDTQDHGSVPGTERSASAPRATSTDEQLWDTAEGAATRSPQSPLSLSALGVDATAEGAPVVDGRAPAPISVLAAAPLVSQTAEGEAPPPVVGLSGSFPLVDDATTAATVLPADRLDGPVPGMLVATSMASEEGDALGAPTLEILAPLTSQDEFDFGEATAPGDPEPMASIPPLPGTTGLLGAGRPPAGVPVIDPPTEPLDPPTEPVVVDERAFPGGGPPSEPAGWREEPSAFSALAGPEGVPVRPGALFQEPTTTAVDPEPLRVVSDSSDDEDELSLDDHGALGFEAEIPTEVVERAPAPAPVAPARRGALRLAALLGLVIVVAVGFGLWRQGLLQPWLQELGVALPVSLADGGPTPEEPVPLLPAASTVAPSEPPSARAPGEAMNPAPGAGAFEPGEPRAPPIDGGGGDGPAPPAVADGGVIDPPPSAPDVEEGAQAAVVDPAAPEGGGGPAPVDRRRRRGKSPAARPRPPAPPAFETLGEQIDYLKQWCSHLKCGREAAARGAGWVKLKPNALRRFEAQADRCLETCRTGR